MDRAQLDKFYKDNVGLVHTATRRCSGRLMKIGMPVDYEDLFQELSVVFIKSYEGFDESRGKFSTYFMWSSYNHVNKMAERHESSIDFHTRSVNEFAGEGEDAQDWAELIPDSAATPEEAIETKQLCERMVSSMSPLAQMIVDATFNPPDFIERELEAAQAHALLSRSQGVQKRAARDVTIGMVCGLFEAAGIDRRAILDARREIGSAYELTYNT